MAAAQDQPQPQPRAASHRADSEQPQPQSQPREQQQQDEGDSTRPPERERECCCGGHGATAAAAADEAAAAHAAASAAPAGPRVRTRLAASPQQLYDLYAQDRLVLHSIPLFSMCARPGCFKDDSSLMCGSLLFFRGLRHRPSGGQATPNGVARFGDESRVRSTVFASLHDLQARKGEVWADHHSMEAQKPPERRHPHGPFVFFQHHDMADMANAAGGQPPDSYLDCHPGGPGPHYLARHPGFDFRAHCEGQPLPRLPREAASKGIQWNEIRAALSYRNMVGLAFIHDPSEDPRQYLAEAERLRRELAAAVAEEAQASADGAAGRFGSGSRAGAAAGGSAAGGTAPAPPPASPAKASGGSCSCCGAVDAAAAAAAAEGEGEGQPGPAPRLDPGQEESGAEAKEEGKEGKEGERGEEGERGAAPAPRLDLVMCVLAVDQARGVNGHLVVVEGGQGEGEGEGEAEGKEAGEGGGRERGWERREAREGWAGGGW
ncbi:hypothetical protein HYH03_018626 [Edaphochlamys debaryana]|uniref:Uncharacterized protein n=1 Tax=Edaphochlamys debaryana TaxID=47281 RepID=A0A836BN49_9CHLO|nr:hypothetical protein HYH03_018626 [Edaphochlamys debaryana]|eukprot:KAG2482457.1 hypothetical protein HYH03_018626 [Edaphochlamys debaryana]